MTYTEQDKKLIEEFQNFADSIVWSNDDGSEKYIGVGNMADWWLDKIHQAIAEERESVRAVIEKYDPKSLDTGVAGKIEESIFRRVKNDILSLQDKLTVKK